MLMLLASALTWLALAIVIGYPFAADSNRSGAVRDYAALLMKIEEMYIGDYEQDDIAAEAMRAAVYALEDPWSFYMTPEEYASYLESSKNRYEGLGINIVPDEETGAMLVVSVFRNSSAEVAGILAGDIIVAIDGTDIHWMSSSEVKTILTRPIGDMVRLTVIRPDGTIQIIDAAYSHIYVDPVSFEMLDGDIGYIILANFNESAAERFIAAADSLIEQGARGFVFDFRGNPGGWVTEVTAILDYLLPEGEVFVTVDRDGNEAVTMSDESFIDLPAVAMVDRFSFSGAEYVAALLREYGYAQVVGEHTTGKSRMQTNIELPGGGAVNLSIAEYLTKNRVSLHDAGGLKPDHEIMLSEEEMSLLYSRRLDVVDDPQLLKALEVLEREISFNY